MSEIIFLVLGSIFGYYIGKEKFRFESAHKKRIEVIEQLYKNLIITHRAFKELMNPMQFDGVAKDEKRKKLITVANTFSEHFFENRIFFENELSKDIENINSELQKIWIDWEYTVDFPETPQKEKLDNWMTVWKKIDKEMGDVVKDLENKFRAILGIM